MPAVVRLIQVRFPNLIDNILKLKSPWRLRPKSQKMKYHETGKFARRTSAYFYYSLCRKSDQHKSSFGQEKSFVDGAISISEIYLKILSALGK